MPKERQRVSATAVLVGSMPPLRQPLVLSPQAALEQATMAARATFVAIRGEGGRLQDQYQGREPGLCLVVRYQRLVFGYEQAA